MFFLSPQAAPAAGRRIALYLLILFFFFPAALPAAWASGEVRLFIVEKSKNPQNILVVYTRADDQCRISPVVYGGKAYLFDFYWLMDGTRYKPTHPLIKKHARRRFVAQKQFENHKGFNVRLADLKELAHDLPTDLLTVTLNRAPGGECQARVQLPLGPSAQDRTMEIQSIYSKARTFLGIPIGVHYVELRGQDAQSRQPLTVRFDSR